MVPGCLGDLLGMILLPNYMGIIMNHYGDYIAGLIWES